MYAFFFSFRVQKSKRYPDHYTRSALTLKQLTGDVYKMGYFLLWHMSTCGIYQAAREECVVLEAGAMSNRKTLTSAKLWWLDNWVRASPEQQVLWGASIIQWFIPTKSSKKDKRLTGDKVMHALGLLMRVGSEGWPVLSDHTGERLYWHSNGARYHNTLSEFLWNLSQQIRAILDLHNIRLVVLM